MNTVKRKEAVTLKLPVRVANTSGGYDITLVDYVFKAEVQPLTAGQAVYRGYKTQQARQITVNHPYEFRLTWRRDLTISVEGILKWRDMEFTIADIREEKKLPREWVITAISKEFPPSHG